MDRELARFCILVNACHRKYLVSRFTPVKTFDDTLTSSHVSAWNVTGDRFLASNFMKSLRKKVEKTLEYLLKIAKKFTDVNEFKICAILNHSSYWYQCKVNVVRVVIAIQ